MIIVVIILILILLLLKMNVKEKFDSYGMSYINQHKYFKCCGNHGCNSRKCQRVLRAKKSNLELYGYLANDSNDVYNLYRRLDQNTNRYIYFVKVKNDQKDVYYKELDKTKYIYLYDGDTVIFNGDDYEVSTYSNYNNYNNNGNSWINKWSVPNYYVNPHMDSYNYNVYGRGLNNTGIMTDSNGKFKILYRKSINRNQYEYYVKMNDVFVKLDRDKNEIYSGDIVSFNGVDYTYDSN
jgi:hypothetical protein